MPMVSVSRSCHAHRLLAPRNRHVGDSFAPQRQGESFRLVRLTVHEANTRAVVGVRTEEFKQVGLIRVSGEAADVYDIGPLVPASAAKVDRRPALKQLASQAPRSLVAN